MIRRPPRSTLDRSSAASDVYKRQGHVVEEVGAVTGGLARGDVGQEHVRVEARGRIQAGQADALPVSYTHLRAHETVLDLVCRLLLEKKKENKKKKT